MLPRVYRLIAPTAIVTSLILSPSLAKEVVIKPIIVPEMKAVYGQVESRVIVPARARIGGVIQEIHVAEGDYVTEGQVIAQIIDDKLALQLRAAGARIEALNSQLLNAKLELERAERLLASGTGTRARVDQARTQYDVAVNQVAAAVAEKAVVKQSAKEGDVLAPASGRVLTVPITLGSVAMAGEPIARVAPGPYYLRLSLPERHAAEIVEGAEVLIGARGMTKSENDSAQSLTGRISKVYPEISEGRVIADVEVNDIGDYFVNERTIVSIPVGSRSVLAVPPEAVRTVHGIDYVRLTANGNEMDVAVILGATVMVGDEPRLEILSGLRAGDQVIVP